MKLRGRPHKFSRQEYVGRTASFTLCIKDRSIVFTDDEIFKAMLRLMLEAAEQHFCLFPAFCFMPDHAHILVKAGNDNANPLDALHKFKLRSGIWLSKRGLPTWQYGCWDTMIGSNRSWQAHARYILLNPVRAGLVEDIADYPYLGNLHGELGDVFE